MTALIREPSAKSTIDHRCRFIDAPPDRCKHAFYDQAKLTIVGKGLFCERQLTSTFDENLLGAVHHDFGDAFISHTILPAVHTPRSRR